MADASIKITAEDRASQIIRNVRGSLSGLDTGIASITGALAKFGALGGLFGGAGAFIALKNTIDALDSLAETAPGIGLAASELSSLQISARAAGVSSEELTGGVSKFASVLDEARNGSKEAAATLRALGIGQKELADGTLTTSDALKRAADTLSGYRDGFEKTALARDAFGRGGAKFIAFLNEGSAGLTKFGGASEEAIKDAAKLNEAIDRLSASWEKFKFNVAGGVASLFRGADYTGESPADELERLNKEIDLVRAKIARTEEPTLLAQWLVALEGLEGAAERVRAKIAKLQFDSSMPADDKPLPPKRDVGAAERAAKAAREGAEAFRKYQQELQKNAEAAAKAEQAYIDLENAASDLEWEKYAKGVKQYTDDIQALDDELFALSGRLEDSRKLSLTLRLEDVLRKNPDAYTAEELERIVKGIAGIKEAAKDGEDAFANLQRATERWGEEAIDTFLDFVTTGKASFKDLVDSILRDLLRIVIRQQLVTPLLNTLFGAAGSGGGGMFGSIGAGIASSAAGGQVKSAGASIVINNNVGAAYGDAGLAKALEQTKRATLAELQDLQARGRLAMG